MVREGDHECAVLSESLVKQELRDLFTKYKLRIESEGKNVPRIESEGKNVPSGGGFGGTGLGGTNFGGTGFGGTRSQFDESEATVKKASSQGSSGLQVRIVLQVFITLTTRYFIRILMSMLRMKLMCRLGSSCQPIGL